ncbi:MAG TPA: DUF4153 domain-containing protein, partial [Longimicrobium sp.]|nr:DUF4153 domain-containing protein [Longimicrobium sp.]
LAVLYAYAVKVLATGELPRNLVSPLVIAAGLIGLLGAVLLEPVHDDDEHRGVSLLIRAVPALLLPLVPLALWALGARLGEYGWTEFRYVRVAAVVAIGILAVAGTIRLVRRGRPLQGTVPAVFAAVLLLSALGPWSAPAVSRRDQTDRLRAELRRARIDPRTLPADSVQVDSAGYARIASASRYLLDAHGIGALQAVIPSLPDTTRSVWAMGETLGLRLRDCGPLEWSTGELAWQGQAVRGLMGGTLAEVQLSASQPAELAAVGLRATLTDDRLRVQGAGWSAEADLAPLRARLWTAPQNCTPGYARVSAAVQLAPPDALVTLRDGSGQARAQLVVTRISVGMPVARTPSAKRPGVHVREVTGFLVVP